MHCMRMMTAKDRNTQFERYKAILKEIGGNLALQQEPFALAFPIQSQVLQFLKGITEKCLQLNAFAHAFLSAHL